MALGWGQRAAESAGTCSWPECCTQINKRIDVDSG